MVVLFYDNGNFTVKDSIFRANPAEYGGALDSHGQNGNIENCLFDSNEAISGSCPVYSGGRGAILFNDAGSGSKHTVTKSIFINNQAGDLGSAIKNDASGTTVRDCVIVGPKTLNDNPIFQGSGDSFAYNWFGHTVDNKSTPLGLDMPEVYYVLNLGAVAEDDYYNITLSLNNLYNSSSVTLSPYDECKLHNITFNVYVTEVSVTIPSVSKMV